MNKNNLQPLPPNHSIIPFTDYSGRTNEDVVDVKNKKKNIKLWILLAGILILVAAIIISILVATKVISKRNSTGRYLTICICQ
jgi:hypothetical protein